MRVIISQKWINRVTAAMLTSAALILAAPMASAQVPRDAKRPLDMTDIKTGRPTDLLVNYFSYREPRLITTGEAYSTVYVEGTCYAGFMFIGAENLQSARSDGTALTYRAGGDANIHCKDAHDPVYPATFVGMLVTPINLKEASAEEVVEAYKVMLNEIMVSPVTMKTAWFMVHDAVSNLFLHHSQAIRKAYGIMLDNIRQVGNNPKILLAMEDIILFEESSLKFRQMADKIRVEWASEEAFVPERAREYVSPAAKSPTLKLKQEDVGGSWMKKLLRD